MQTVMFGQFCELMFDLKMRGGKNTLSGSPLNDHSI